jgi:hypothetical protein
MQATQPALRKGEVNNGLARHYSVASVDKAQGPGEADGDWYRYVLVGGRSPITGLRRGTRDEVTEHANRCAEELNERNNGKSASAWAPRKAK